MRDVTIVDVSPRDGLQNQPNLISTEDKVKLVDKLLEARVDTIEVTSFVHPKIVPQMADAEELLDNLSEKSGLNPIALIPNLKGLERAAQYEGLAVNWVASATETFNKKNIGMSIEENYQIFQTAIEKAKNDNINFCFSVAVSFGCPYEGKVNEVQVLRLIEKALALGVDKIGIADTIGIATPLQVSQLMSKVLAEAGDTPVVLHLHDTRGLGAANAYAAYEAGVRIFETAVGGIGGCPFAPGSAGNLATEDLVYLFERMGVHTGIDFEKLMEAADFAANLSTNEALGKIRRLDRERIIRELKI